MSILAKPYFHDEKAAFAKLEAILWPTGPVCPHCGNDKKAIYSLEGVRSKPSKKNPQGLERHGLKKCGACRKQFTVRVGTLFESSHIPLHKWFQGCYLMCSSKKGISAHQLHRILEITYKSAWFLAHRIREAMRNGDLGRTMGSGGSAVEMDETYFGQKTKFKKPQGHSHKHAVVSLVDRSTGEVRSFHVDKVNSKQISILALKNIDREAKINTDEAAYYNNLKTIYKLDRQSVNHSRMEWRRGDVSTNTIEGYFSIFKRGMKGVYQHCSEKHLHRYLAEFDFRYSNRVKLGVDDEMRTEKALSGIKGKRLLYEGSL